MPGLAHLRSGNGIEEQERCYFWLPVRLAMLKLDHVSCCLKWEKRTKREVPNWTMQILSEFDLSEEQYYYG